MKQPLRRTTQIKRFVRRTAYMFLVVTMWFELASCRKPRGGTVVEPVTPSRATDPSPSLTAGVKLAAHSGYSEDPPYAPGQSVWGPIPCGDFGQMPCEIFVYDAVNGMVPTTTYFCGREGLRNKELVPSNPPGDGQCVIDQSSWIAKGLDMTRADPGNPNCGPGTTTSCWAVDDLSRDQLTFNTDALGFVYYLKAGLVLADGRYIYVYRKRDDTVVVRRYDRQKDGNRPTCASYNQFRASQNFRPSSDPGADEPQYLHVRHSQLAGSTTETVWAAGELRVKNGAIDIINNGSGHFQPDVSAIAYLRIKLFWERIPVSSEVRTGVWTNVPAAEDVCPPASSPPDGADDDQALKDEL